MRYLLAFLFVLALVLPLTTYAAPFDFVQIVPDICDCDDVIGPDGAPTPSAPAFGCVLQVVQNIIRVMIAIGFVMAAFAIIYAGFTWMTSGGSAEKRSKGKNLIINVIVGIVVILTAWLVVDFIMKSLTKQDEGMGPWNNMLSGQGASADRCLVARDPNGLSSGQASLRTFELGTGGQLQTGGPREGVVTSRNLSHAAAVPILTSAGVEIKEGASLQGTTENAVRQMAALRQQCNCAVTVTSGTDGTHAQGALSHAEGYKIDLRLTDSLNSFLQSNLTRSGSRGSDPRYYDRCGNEYVRESNHWDITVSRGVCSPLR